MGTLYRDELITKSLKIGNRNQNFEVGYVNEDEHGEIEGFGMRMLVPEATPVEPEAAVLVLGTGNAEVTFTAQIAGTDAEKWSIEIVDPDGAEDQELAVDVDLETFEVKIHPATDGSGVITTTANALVTEFNATDGVNDQITASVESGTGADPVVPEGPKNLDGGVDGLAAPKGAVVFDADFVYISVEESFVHESHWKKVELADLSSA